MNATSSALRGIRPIDVDALNSDGLDEAVQLARAHYDVWVIARMAQPERSHFSRLVAAVFEAPRTALARMMSRAWLNVRLLGYMAIGIIAAAATASACVVLFSQANVERRLLEVDNKLNALAEAPARDTGVTHLLAENTTVLGQSDSGIGGFRALGATDPIAMLQYFTLSEFRLATSLPPPYFLTASGDDVQVGSEAIHGNASVVGSPGRSPVAGIWAPAVVGHIVSEANTGEAEVTIAVMPMPRYHLWPENLNFIARDGP